MRIWVDISAPAHVLVLRPIVDRLRRRGHDVEITARDYAQTIQLLEMHGMEHAQIGRHGGVSRLSKGRRLLQRTAGMRKWGGERDFDLALAHGSNDLAIAARTLGIPEANMHDYEYATLQHQIGCRLATRVIFPDTVPADRLARLGAGPDKLVQYPGLKEEYYLYDLKLDGKILDALGVNESKVVVVLRPPPDVSLYHRKSNPLFPQVLARIDSDPHAEAVVLPRSDEQREYVKGLALPSVTVAERAVDAQSLIAKADLVVSAGGTMNREAVALGTPVYTTYGGRLGGVDEALIRGGRLHPLTDARAVELEKRREDGIPTKRDPDVLVDMVLGTLR